MACRGIRGAITVEQNTQEAILEATRTLLQQIAQANALEPAEIASVFLTATPDLDAVAPARAAREMGWTDVPLICVQEMAVPGSLPMCIRVLIHWNTERAQHEIHHIYIGRARILRPDWVKEEEESE